MATIMLTHPAAKRIGRHRDSSTTSWRVNSCINRLDHPVLTDAVRRIVDSHHLSVLATTNADGSTQTSVIFIKRDGDNILFSTIKGRRKTTNMFRDPRVNLLVHSLPVGDALSTYATISGVVELYDDPGGSFHQVMYDIHMGGATPPPEPGAERVIVRIIPQRVYVPPPYQGTPEE
jgi:PPOX class probable F420-dependent enzyme